MLCHFIKKKHNNLIAILPWPIPIPISTPEPALGNNFNNRNNNNKQKIKLRFQTIIYFLMRVLLLYFSLQFMLIHL